MMREGSTSLPQRIRAEIGRIRAGPLPRQGGDQVKRGFVPTPQGRGRYETWRETSALRP